MKTKNIILAALACVIILTAIGCKRSSPQADTQHSQEVAAKLETVLLKMEKLNKEMEELKSELNTVKLGGKDYSKEIQEMVRKQVQQMPSAKQTGGGPRVAVISIRRIFQESRKGASYRDEAIAEQNRIIAEMDKLAKEIEAGREGLKALKENSSDYMDSAKALFEKQANYQARNEFYKQQMELKDQLWTREIYQGIMQIAGEIAKEKGLDLVFKEDEIDFSEPDISELGLALRTQKLLYSGGCLDITDEVKARLDSGK
ncbi:MAG: OmpH family outer membrane protein [Sedimentisphaerales bacterium]|nr:OmpH family outer membrane protein [Sedimentisphaerales bacterium]